MNCELFRNAFRALEEGAENLEQLGGMREHFRGCPACQKEIPDGELTLDLFLQMKALPIPDPGEKFWQNLPGQIRSRMIQEEQTGRIRLFRWRFAAVACTALLALFTIPFWGTWRNFIGGDESVSLAEEVHQDPWAPSSWQNMKADELSILYTELLTPPAQHEPVREDDDFDHVYADSPPSIQVYEISDQMPDDDFNYVLNDLETLEI